MTSPVEDGSKPKEQLVVVKDPKKVEVEGSKPYVQYTIESLVENKKVQVLRRYIDFIWLRNRLTRSYEVNKQLNSNFSYL